MNISDQYILPPVRKLGLMLEADEKESKKLRAQIERETEAANEKMKTLLKKQKNEFLTKMHKRRDELENMYKPIFDRIPAKRQREIEEEVKEAAAAVPRTVKEKRTTKTVPPLPPNVAEEYY